MEEFAAWIVLVADGTVVSKHVVLATRFDGDLVEVASPDFPSDMEPGTVLIMGLLDDVSQLVQSLQPRQY